MWDADPRLLSGVSVRVTLAFPRALWLEGLWWTTSSGCARSASIAPMNKRSNPVAIVLCAMLRCDLVHLDSSQAFFIHFDLIQAIHILIESNLFHTILHHNETKLCHMGTIGALYGTIRQEDVLQHLLYVFAIPTKRRCWPWAFSPCFCYTLSAWSACESTRGETWDSFEVNGGSETGAEIGGGHDHSGSSAVIAVLVDFLAFLAHA